MVTKQAESRGQEGLTPLLLRCGHQANQLGNWFDLYQEETVTCRLAFWDELVEPPNSLESTEIIYQNPPKPQSISKISKPFA